MTHYFTLDNSPIYKNKYVLRFNMVECPFPNGTEGSYAVFPARLMNLSYPDYLRYTRDRLGAELIGKFNKYVVPYFDQTPEVLAFVKGLNLRMKAIMFEQEHPYELVKKEDGTIVKMSYDGEILDEQEPINKEELYKQWLEEQKQKLQALSEKLKARAMEELKNRNMGGADERESINAAESADADEGDSSGQGN